MKRTKKTQAMANLRAVKAFTKKAILSMMMHI